MAASKTARKAAKKEKDASTAEASPLGDVLDFMRLLWAVNHGLEATSKQLESKTGITGPQRLVIRLVGKYPGISAGRLAEILHLHPSTLTGVLRRLEARGLIERKADPADARRALFSLTQKGKDADVTRASTVETTLKKALRKLARKDLVAAQAVLETIAESLVPEEE